MKETHIGIQLNINVILIAFWCGLFYLFFLTLMCMLVKCSKKINRISCIMLAQKVRCINQQLNIEFDVNRK